MASSHFSTVANRTQLVSDKSNQPDLRKQLLAQNEANVLGLWYDWFCSELSLFNRGKRLWSAASSIANSSKFDAAKCYVFFKNNCPMQGPTYDDFRICDIATGDVLFTVTRNAWGFKGWQVYDIKNGGGADSVVEGSWAVVKAWFLAKPEQLSIGLALGSPQLKLN
jgi:hypothetical protein